MPPTVSTPRSRRGDFWSGLVLAGLGAYIVSQAWGWEYLGPDGPGAGFFPLWYGVAMMVLSLALVVQSIRRPASTPDRSTENTGDVRRALGCWIVLVLGIVLMKFVGFLIGFAALTWYMVVVLFRQSLLKGLAIAAAFALGFYLLFGLALGVALPSGVF
jgi:putative tricarboxylic transport membrane protein